MKKKNIYIDVDDTIIRTVGSKVMPITDTIKWIRENSETHNLYLWSRGGGDYAKNIAEKLQINGCFLAFLPKPDALIDDQDFLTWTHLKTHYPSNIDI